MQSIIRFLLITLFSFMTLTIYANSSSSQPKTKTDSSAVSRPSVDNRSTDSHKVNINSADLNSLISIRGIGPKRAQAIIDYRTQHGSFHALEELAKVKGINEHIFAKLVKDNPDRLITE